MDHPRFIVSNQKEESISRAFSSNLGKRPVAKIGKKMFNLTAKLGDINEIEHITRVAKYILKISYLRLYHSDMGHCFSFSKKSIFFSVS